MLFAPDCNLLSMMVDYPTVDIKNEPMLFSADLQFAYDNAGPITSDFLAALDPDDKWIIDSRVHMLMAGWYPCIPGWHHDDVVRSRVDGQPNYDDPRWDEPEHLCVVVDASDAPTGSLTEFLNRPIELEPLPEPATDKTIYGAWNEEINKLCELHSYQAVTSGGIYSFGTSDFHRGMPAMKSGWRYFARATRFSQRPIANEIRRQVQAYLPAIEGGW